MENKVSLYDVIPAMTHYNCITVPAKRDIELLISMKSEYEMIEEINKNQKVLDSKMEPFDEYREYRASTK